MAEAKVDIITVDAVNNLADLKKAIKDAKDNLATLDLGSKAYRDQLKQVIEGQNLLRAAMNGTTATAEHLKDAIDKEGTSYNALVNQMANLKREFRSATTEAERADIGGRIKEINDELKRMDAMKGDFQRNVGDYFNQVTAPLKSVIQDLPSGLNAIKQPMDDVTKSLSLMGKQPILGILGLLAPLIADIAKGVKENENAMEGVKKIMDSLKPVMDFFSGILQQVVETVGDLIGRLAEFLGSSGIFKRIVDGVVGVGNAILQFVIAPFKGIVEAIKVLKDQGVKGIGDAAKAFGAEMKQGVSFKENFKAGQVFADTITAGAKSRKPGTEVGKAVKKDLEDELLKADDLEKIWEKAMNKMLSKMREQNAFENEMQGVLDEQQALIDAEVEQYIAALEDEAKAEQIVRETEVKMAKEAAKQKLDSMSAYASGASGLLNGIADMLESEGKSAKNLRIAAATIDMISGAVTAFSTAQQLGPIAGPIVGAINAAAVVASGLANIAKIRATNVSKDAAPTSSAPTQAAVSAPALETAVPTTTVINGARTETALNRASQPSRVYVVQSDIEAAAQDTRVQVAESSF
jgi:uncharacterized phage infection (PIP) family protein YhgE